MKRPGRARKEKSSEIASRLDSCGPDFARPGGLCQACAAGGEYWRRAAASFINKVWRVRQSNAVEPAQLYAFLSEGTLVVASPRGKPAFGSWAYKNSELTVQEEGRSYKAEILGLSRDGFSLRVHNPGQPVEIVMVPADDVPLPQ